MFGTGVKRSDKQYKKLLEGLEKKYKKTDYFLTLAIRDVLDNLSKARGGRSDYLDMVVDLGCASTSKIHNWKAAANNYVRNNYAEVKRVYDEMGLDVKDTENSLEIYHTVMDYNFRKLKEIVDAEMSEG